MSSVTRTSAFHKAITRTSTKAAVAPGDYDQQKIISSQHPVHRALSGIKSFRKLNAFTYLAAEENLEEQIQRSTEQVHNGPLKGQPIAVKDNFCVKGMPATCGSRMLNSFRAPYNATLVEKLMSSGAIIVGKTNMDEFGMGNGTVDTIYGPTKNIWGLPVDGTDFHVAGGSSGGSAVAVATGICYGAIGSDTGGSTRNPASYCGTVGLKPTYGSLSRHGLIPLVNSMDVPGILTRRIDDCAIIFDTLKGWDRKDSTTVQFDMSPTIPSETGSVKGLRVGIPKEFECEGMSAEVIQCWRSTADMLQNEGAQVSEVSLPHTKYSIICYSVLNPCEVASNMARYDGLRYGHRAAKPKHNSTEALYAQTRHEGFNAVVRGRILAGNYFLLKTNYDKYFLQALRVRRLILQDYEKLWKSGIDILLTPCTLTTAPKYADFVKWDNRKQSSVQDYCTQPANMAGIPAISIPIKLSEDKLPLSLQLMGPRFSEKILFEAGKLIENMYNFPFFTYKSK